MYFLAFRHGIKGIGKGEIIEVLGQNARPEQVVQVLSVFSHELLYALQEQNSLLWIIFIILQWQPLYAINMMYFIATVLLSITLITQSSRKWCSKWESFQSPDFYERIEPFDKFQAECLIALVLQSTRSYDQDHFCESLDSPTVS